AVAGKSAMQRSAFDVGSIAALLRQTEANLSALNRPPSVPAERRTSPSQHEPRYFSGLAASQCWQPSEPQNACAVFSKGLGSGIELETQVVQLRGFVESLEKRLEDELRSFLAVSDKRLSAREEQLRGIGDTLQASADAAMEQLNRRVDTRLRDLERASHQGQDGGLDEVWESIRRVQADCRGMEGRVQRCAPSEELTDRLREAEQRLKTQLEDRVVAQDRRAVEHRTQLETSSEAWKEAMAQRCNALEQRVWGKESDKADLVDTVIKRMSEGTQMQELKEELRAGGYTNEVQQRRLAACEAKLSKLGALEAKVDFVESQTMQQLEEQAQSGRGLGELSLKLQQKLASSEAACQRVESHSTALEARLQSQVDEDRNRIGADLESLQQRLLQRMEEVDGRQQRTSNRFERELAQQLTAVTQKAGEEAAAVQRQELRQEAKVATEERNSQELTAKFASQATKEPSLALESLRTQAESKIRVLEQQNLQVEGRHAGIDASLSTLEDQQRVQAETQRYRLEALELRLGELQVGVVRAQSSVDAVKSTVIGFDSPGRTTALYKLKLGEVVTTKITNPDVENIEYDRVDFTFWDVGGRTKMRPLWRHYYQNTYAVIFVVNSQEQPFDEMLDEYLDELGKITSDDNFRDSVLVVWANKQDLPGALLPAEIASKLQLHKLRDRTWHIQGTVALTGEGLYESMDWLAKTSQGWKQNTKAIQHRGLDSLASTITAGSNAVVTGALSLLMPPEAADGQQQQQQQEKNKSAAVEGSGSAAMEALILRWLEEEAEEEVTLQQFTDGELKHWGHKERLLLSWLLIQRHGRREAIRLLFQGARRILQASFHETTLYFWMHMVHYAIEATANPLGDFKGFVLMNPQLVNSDLLLDYYTQDTIWHNLDARDEVVMPDKKPLPSLLRGGNQQAEVKEQPQAFMPRELIDQGGTGRVFAALQQVEGDMHNVTESYFWIQMVTYCGARMGETTASFFAEFIRHDCCKVLLDPGLLYSHYSEELLVKGASAFNLPDKKALAKFGQVAQSRK
ncbi:unnamed protein product, partial [Polarella glacialis]